LSVSFANLKGTERKHERNGEGVGIKTMRSEEEKVAELKFKYFLSET
jgi:hypothetical protein